MSTVTYKGQVYGDNSAVIANAMPPSTRYDPSKMYETTTGSSGCDPWYVDIGILCNQDLNTENALLTYIHGKKEQEKDTTMKIEHFAKMPVIKEVIFNPPATIVKWSDGTKTVVKARKEKKAETDEFSEEVGLAMAIAKKFYGSRSAFVKEVKNASKPQKTGKDAKPKKEANAKTSKSGRRKPKKSSDISSAIETAHEKKRG